jgi:UDP-glucose 6-dehydrogenase
MKITVAGVGYVGLSLAVLLAQKHEVTAITTTEAKAEKLNKFFSPIQDDEIERFFAEARAGERILTLHTTMDKAAAYASANLVIIATPTNYDDVNHFFNTSAVEDAIEQTLKVNPNVLIVTKSTIPVDTLSLFGRSTELKISSSAQSFCVNRKHSTITFIRAVSLSAVMMIRKNRLKCSQIFFWKVRE